MSETLRWILIGFAVVLLVGIYLWGRRAGQAEARVRMRPEPSVQPHELDGEAGSSAGVPSGPELQDGSIRVSRRARDRGGSVDEPASALARDEWLSRPRGRSIRVEPTLSEVTAELPVDDAIEPEADHLQEFQPFLAPESARPSAEPPAATLSMSGAPPPRRIERRKIITLRLAAGAQRFEGASLRAALEAESLQHGKYQVFHRLHDENQSIFSIAGMVEPGTFDLDAMAESHYPGLMLFAQLPGPVPGMHALDELLACARRLHESLGGTLQDDRGVPLTVHKIERLRQEIREFERPAAASTSAASHSIGR